MTGYAAAPIQSPIFRQGSKLVVPAPAPGKAAVLPPVCVKCGATANGKPVNKVFYWHHPGLYLVILAGLFIYAIVAVIVRKSIRISVPLCAQHAQRRSTAITLAWGLPLIGIVGAFVLSQFNVDGGIVALIAIVLIVAGIVTWAVVANPITPKFIDQTRGEFTGCCEAFLLQIPEAAQPVPAAPPQGTPPPPPLS